MSDPYTVHILSYRTNPHPLPLILPLPTFLLSLNPSHHSSFHLHLPVRGLPPSPPPPPPSRNISAFVHFDSASYNRSDADRVAKKVATYLDSSSSSFFESSLAAKQENSYDCGMFLISHAETILDQLTTSPNSDLSTLDLKDLIRQRDMEINRGKWQDRIEKLTEL